MKLWEYHLRICFIFFFKKSILGAVSVVEVAPELKLKYFSFRPSLQALSGRQRKTVHRGKVEIRQFKIRLLFSELVNYMYRMVKF